MTSSEDMDRRKFLERIGGAAALAHLTALGSKGGTPHSRPPQKYDYVDSFGTLRTMDPSTIDLGIVPPAGMAEAALKVPQSTITYGTGPQQNILMILVDEMRNPKWFPAGQTQSSFLQSFAPNIYALQQSSLVFNNYFTAATACTPARATLLTGLYTQQNCMFLAADQNEPQLQSGFPTSSGYPTIGWALSNVKQWTQGQPNAGILQNYDTAWIGKWHLSAALNTGNCDLNLTYGFTSSADLPNASLDQNGKRNPTSSPNGDPNEGTEGGLYTTPMEVVEYLASDSEIYQWFSTNWLPTRSAAGSKKPWFCAVSFINPHDIAYFPSLYSPQDVHCNAYLPFGTVPAGTLVPFYANQSINGPVFPPPPTAGDSTKGIPPLSQFNLFKSLPVDSYGNAWNGSPYGLGVNPLPAYGVSLDVNGNGTPGKPDIQVAYETGAEQTAGSVIQQNVDTQPGMPNWTNGWLTFMNYYCWMHACADAQVGNVMTQYGTWKYPDGTPLKNNTIVMFLSDHGEYAGSHGLKGKGGAAYDESMNVPLYIHYPGQSSMRAISNMVSSVDIFPYLLTLASESSAWRTNPFRSAINFSYLGNREAIEDFILSSVPITGCSSEAWAEPATSARRTLTVNDPVGGPPITLQYVLHTFDEMTGDELGLSTPFVAQGGVGQFSHVLALRTSIGTDNEGHYIGGKAVRYDDWPCNYTAPPGFNGASPVSGYHPQYEYYSYVGAQGACVSLAPSNINENVNEVVLSGYEPSPSTSLAAQLFAKLAGPGIMSGPNSELYALPAVSQIQQAYTTALANYFAAVASKSQCSV